MAQEDYPTIKPLLDNSAGPLCRGASVYQQAGAAPNGARSHGNGRQAAARPAVPRGFEDVIDAEFTGAEVIRPRSWSVDHWGAWRRQQGLPCG